MPNPFVVYFVLASSQLISKCRSHLKMPKMYAAQLVSICMQCYLSSFSQWSFGIKSRIQALKSRVYEIETDTVQQ